MDNQAADLIHEDDDDVSEYRARVFILANDNEWTDVATGLCKLELSTTTPATPVPVVTLSIVHDLHDDPQLASRQDSAILYQVSLDAHTEIAVQQDTVLSWARPDGTDIAVSFETEAGCQAVWARLCRFQGKTVRGLPRPEAEEDELGAAEVQLPQVVDASTLADIEASLAASSQNPWMRHDVCSYLLEEHYLERLVSLFRSVEPMQDLHLLRLLYSSLRSIVSLNSFQLFREILSEPLHLDVAGIFEYEEPVGIDGYVNAAINPPPPTGGVQRPKYRDYLADTTRYKQVVPVKSPQLLAKIHETFRAQYFKDVILPRVLDDDTFTTMVMLIRSNHLEIITGLEEEGEIYDQLYRTSDAIVISS